MCAAPRSPRANEYYGAATSALGCYHSSYVVVPKLALSNLSVRRVRSALTIAAIALSVSLVVAVTSGYTSAEASATRFLSRFMGTADAMVAKKGENHPLMPQTLVTQLAADPDVKRVTGRLELEGSLLKSDGTALAGRPAQWIGIDRPGDTRIENLALRSGNWFESNTGNIAVIDQVASEKLNANVGDSFSLTSVSGTLKLKVVGIVQKPAILASAVQSVYIPLATLQHFAQPDSPPQVNRIMIDLTPKADLTKFVDRWNPRLAQIDPLLSIRLARDNRKQLDANLQGVKLLSYLGGAVSMLAATFIVFSALSMGVAERSRMLAMLRAVGALRRQIAGVVILEGLLLATAGVLLGVFLGWVWLSILVWKFRHLFASGVSFSAGGLLLGAGGSMLAALLASALPAFTATRVSPLEALGPQTTPTGGRPPRGAAIAGLLLICIDPLNTYLPWQHLLAGKVHQPAAIGKAISFYGHFVYGVPSLMLGFFLLAPTLVWLLERLLGPILALLLGLRGALLRQQLSAGLWRAAGTCAALMVGLSILVAMEVQGNSLLKGWELPDVFPDLFIVSWTGSLNQREINKLAHTDGIKPGDLMPVALASPEFGGDSPFALLGIAAAPDATLFLGIPPEQAMRMMQLKFRQGNAKDAVRMLKEGRHVIVTDEFYQLKHLGLGDKLPLKTTKHGTVDYTIAGVAWSPGVDVIVQMFDMGRQFDQRTAASVFGSIDDARKDFGVDGIRLFAANLNPAVDRDSLLHHVQGELHMIGLQAGDVRAIKNEIEHGFGDVLLLVSLVPMAAMAIASLGVTNTIMASIRSRRWQLGVLRSVGLTRSALLRLILSEALLVGIVGCALGLLAGSVLAIDAREMARFVMGVVVPVAIPWGLIIIGTAVVMAMALLASVWPATNVAMAEPLSLLQAGRAAT